MNELVQMGIDLYYGKTDKFSKDETENAFKQALLDICGGNFTAKTDPMSKWKVFNLITEVIDAVVPKTLEGQFDQFVDTQDIAWGDELIVEVTDPSLFKVATIANGTANVRRQRLDRGTANIVTAPRSVKIYDEFLRFVAGKIDWVLMVNRVAQSFALQIKTDIYTAIYNSYSALNATYQASGSFNSSTFNTLVAHVEAACNAPAVCFGTKVALSKITPSAGFTAYPGLMTQDMMGEVNKQGYLGNFQGTPLIELQQAHIPGTENFAISDNFSIIIPQNGPAGKIAHLGFEGETIVQDNSVNMNADMSKEFAFIKSYGILILSAAKYGIYQVS